MPRNALRGLAATLALGAGFSLLPAPGPEAPKAEGKPASAAALDFTRSPRSRSGGRPEAAGKPFTFPPPFEPPQSAAAPKGEGNGGFRNRAEPEPVQGGEEYLAMAPRGDGARFASAVRLSPPSPAAASAALGSLAPRDLYPGAVPLPEKRDKGLRFWAGTSFNRERAASRGNRDFGHYRRRGQIHRLGADYDLSADVVVKAGLEFSRGKVLSLYPGDHRTGDVSAGILSLSGDWLFGDNHILSVKAFYGRAEIGTSGDLDLMGGGPAQWREERWRSSIQGFSGKLSFSPMRWLDFKLSPEIGLELTRIGNPARRIDLFVGNFHLANLESPAKTSTSLALSSTLRIERDYRRGWGWLVPRLDLGLPLELGNSGETAGNLGAGALPPLEYGGTHFDGEAAAGLKSAAVARYGCLFGLGLDLRWNNGWEAGADFGLIWNPGRLRHEFRLEARKCF